MSEIKPIREWITNLPKAITFSQFPSITAYSDAGEEEEGDAIIGDIAEQYLRKLAAESGADATFVLHDKDDKFCIAKKERKVKENNIIADDREYVGTLGLWELIVTTTPDDNIFKNGNYDNYAEIMHLANALRRNNDEIEYKPKANRSWKWKDILKPHWDEKDLYTENGVTPSISTIILQCDPIARVEK